MTAIDTLTRKLMDLGATTEIVVLVVEAVTAVTRDSHTASQMSRVTVTHVTPDDVRKAACLRKRKQREREKQQRLAAKEAEANDAAATAVTVTNVTRDKRDMSQNAPTDLLTSLPSFETLNKQESSEEGSKQKKNISSEKARATRIPADWQLEQRHIDYAISKGVAPDRITGLGEKFKTYSMAASGKNAVSPDWFLKWCTWVLNDVEWNGSKNGQQSNGHRAAQTAGSGATGQDAILAGMGRLAAKVAERGAAERRDREASERDDAPDDDDARLL